MDWIDRWKDISWLSEMKPAGFADTDLGNSSEGYGGLGSKHLEQGDPGNGLKSPRAATVITESWNHKGWKEPMEIT